MALVPRRESLIYVMSSCIIWSSCNQHIVIAVHCPSLFMSTWQVPYDGPVDSSFLISATSAQSAVPALPAPADTQPLGVSWCQMVHGTGAGSVSETSLNLGSFDPCHLPSWQSSAQPPLRRLRYGSYQYSQQYSQEQSIKQKQQEMMQQQQLSTLGGLPNPVLRQLLLLHLGFYRHREWNRVFCCSSAFS